MIIHPIQKETHDGDVYLSAQITFDWMDDPDSRNQWYKQWGIPEKLWFRVPEAYSEDISTHSDAFLVALLGVAMHLKEDIHVRGTISPQLLYNLDEYQNIAHFWHPHFFAKVAVTADTLTEVHRADTTRRVMCSISGGLDSFYTIWSHLARNMVHKEFQLTHVLYIEGFDITLDEHATHAHKIRRYSEIANAENLEFIRAATNLRMFERFARGRNEESLLENAGLSAMILLFAGCVSHFIYSSDEAYKSHTIFNAYALLMSLISTNVFKTTVFGQTISKQRKIQVLTRWPDILDSVVTCHAHPDRLQNCGTCKKCLKVIALLEIEDVLALYSTYPRTINYADFRKIRYGADDIFSYISIRSLIRPALEKRKWVLVVTLLWVLVKSSSMNVLQTIYDDLVFLCRALNHTFNPVLIVYRLSKKLKHVSPTYARIVHRCKRLYL